MRREITQTDPQRMAVRGDTERPRAEGSGELRVQPIQPVDSGQIIDDTPVRDARRASAAPLEPIRDGVDGIDGVDLGVDQRSWRDIKGRFVDDPAGAISAAEELVRLAVDHKVRALKDEAAALCAHDTGDAPSTEALRTRLIDYQAYCERLARNL
jgi:hypothetical protein